MHMARILRAVVLPELKARAPVNTGSLRRSIKIVQRGPAVELRGNFYGRFVSIQGQSGLNVATLAMQIIEQRRDEIRERLKAALRSEFGI